MKSGDDRNAWLKIVASGQTVIVVGNEHCDAISNPGRDCLYFTFMLIPLEKTWIHLLFSPMSKYLGRPRSFTSEWEQA